MAAGGTNGGSSILIVVGTKKISHWEKVKIDPYPSYPFHFGLNTINCTLKQNTAGSLCIAAGFDISVLQSTDEGKTWMQKDIANCFDRGMGWFDGSQCDEINHCSMTGTQITDPTKGEI